jgi:hypothetical protein
MTRAQAAFIGATEPRKRSALMGKRQIAIDVAKAEFVL